MDPLLTVTDIYLEKAVPTQAISGPFDLGRPLHCPTTRYVGGTRLEPIAPTPKKTKAGKHGKGKGAEKAKSKGKTNSKATKK